MTHDIGVWEIDQSSNTARPLPSADHVETERLLEDLLVANPGMLMPNLWLVGRQTPTDGGAIDLLGVDEDGRLVVFELKRGKLTRDAVAQIVDYCSYLESLNEDALVAYIADHSGTNGIAEIDDFEARYRERKEEELTSMRPVRMVLVGLGADAAAHRMVDFLAARELDISLLTFHGWRHGTNTLLARQVESVKVGDAGRRSRPSQAERRRLLDERAERLGIAPLWQSAVNALDIDSRKKMQSSSITFRKRKIKLPDASDRRHGASHSVAMTDDCKIRVTFYPVAIDLCLEQFRKMKEIVGFRLEPPPNAFPTERVSEQWYCVLDQDEWEAHRDRLIELAETVRDAWRAARDDEAPA